MGSRRERDWLLLQFIGAFNAYWDAVDEQNRVCSAQDAFAHDAGRIARNPRIINSHLDSRGFAEPQLS